MRRRWIFLAPLAIPAFLLFIVIGGEIVLLLWNWLLPPLFGWPQITFWQALGLLALCRILFGGRGGHSFSGSMRRRMADRMADRMTDRMRERMGERMEPMTPEERERFRERMRECFGFGASTGESKGQ